MDKLLLWTHIDKNTWRMRWEIAKHHPTTFRSCVAAFVLSVVALIILL